MFVLFVLKTLNVSGSDWPCKIRTRNLHVRRSFPSLKHFWFHSGKFPRQLAMHSREDTQNSRKKSRKLAITSEGEPERERKEKGKEREPFLAVFL